MSFKTSFYTCFVKARPYLIALGLTFTLGFLFFWNRIVITVYSGELGVKYSRFFTGTNLDAPYSEGVHLIWPFDIMYVYDMRYIQYTQKITIPTREGMPVNIVVSCIYQLDFDNLPLFHQQVGPQYKEKLIIPMISSVVRQVVGSYTAEDLFSTARQAIEDYMLIGAISTLGKLPITIHKFLVKNVEFPLGFTDSIVTKMVASQELETYEYLLQIEGEEAKRKFIEGLGIQQYQELINSGMTAEYLNFEGIKATQKLATSNNAKIVVVGSGENGLPLILNTQSDSSKSQDISENELTQKVQNLESSETTNIDKANAVSDSITPNNPENPTNSERSVVSSSPSDPTMGHYSQSPKARNQQREENLVNVLPYLLDRNTGAPSETLLSHPISQKPRSQIQEKWDEFVKSVTDVLSIQITPDINKTQQ